MQSKGMRPIVVSYTALQNGFANILQSARVRLQIGNNDFAAC